MLLILELIFYYLYHNDSNKFDWQGKLFWHGHIELLVWLDWKHYNVLIASSSTVGELAQMVERSLSMWEVRGSMPRFSKEKVFQADFIESVWDLLEMQFIWTRPFFSLKIRDFFFYYYFHIHCRVPQLWSTCGSISTLKDKHITVYLGN